MVHVHLIDLSPAIVAAVLVAAAIVAAAIVAAIAKTLLSYH
jgi:hypothetical protein